MSSSFISPPIRLLGAFILGLFLCAATLPAMAVTWVTSPGPILLGANNVIVNGSPYDVRFIDGTCIELFSGCDAPADFTFTTPASALAAAQALMDTVFLDGVGPFDTQPWTTNGCSSTFFCGAIIPYALRPWDSSSSLAIISFARNEPPLLDPAAFFSQELTTSDYGLVPTHTWAVFTPATNTPEPASLALLGSGLLAFAALRRCSAPRFVHVGWRIRRAWLLAVFAALPLLATSSAQAELIGVSTTTNGLYRINPVTGVATLLSTVQGDVGASGVGLLGTDIYLSNVLVNNDIQTMKVAQSTGVVTPVSNQGNQFSWWGMTANRNTNRLYAVEINGATAPFQPLNIINPVTGAFTPIGQTSVLFRGLAYNNRTDTLYGINATDLFTINTATALATRIGPLNVDAIWGGLAFDEQTGMLYMTADFDGLGSIPSNLFSLDPQTGAARFIRSTGINTIDGLDWRPDALSVPEPASLALFGSALLGLATLRRRLFL